MSLTDTQLRDLSVAMEFPLAGVVFKDDMPKKLEFNKGYIINLEDEFDEDGKPNSGSHWTCLQINKYPNGKVEGIYFDPYGVGMPQDVAKAVKNTIGKGIPHSTKDVQSLMNNACGYYCSAFLHFINTSQYRTRDLFQDVSIFLDLFDDLNKSVDFKKNEYILKHFFRAKNAEKRIPVEKDNITTATTGDGIDLTKIPVGVSLMSKKG